ncbi:hypothetical protein [Hoylesella oralis]|uniref:hypothetical protein n=1 Tax=Hoylesella oralis TaxID=28134 RepID=UPI0028E3C3F0|nr:hypothetical protein [Hoylesella oralis]
MRKILLLNSGRKAIAGMAEGTFWKRICLVYFQRKILVPFVHGVSVFDRMPVQARQADCLSAIDVPNYRNIC